LNPAGEIVRGGRVLRLRFDLETTTIFFDRLSGADAPVPVASVSLAPPSSGNVGRIQWDEFVAALPTALQQTVGGVPPVEDRAYIRELLQLAVVDDLLGPAGGPHERIVDMG
ncbi:hypothetical protein QO161_33070, partial [Pseudomonas aeruginosa]|uniref:hypothetical protein n=1 Tax=Pseudomonas aeruginosa TaxID=287 RepID=UPI002E8E66FA|nr:hypothetical protein [Pseudomonas aeruginosa]